MFACTILLENFFHLTYFTSQRARFQAVESLNVKNTIVIATDVAARGLDWTAIPTVIHYDAARTVEAFVHRSGRTAVSGALCGIHAHDLDDNWIVRTRVSEYKPC